MLESVVLLFLGGGAVIIFFRILCSIKFLKEQHLIKKIFFYNIQCYSKVWGQYFLFLKKLILFIQEAY